MPVHDDENMTAKPIFSPEAHGQAALLLVESLMHSLMEHAILTLSETVEVVETAISVQADIALAADAGRRQMWRSHALLTRIADSLSNDVGVV